MANATILVADSDASQRTLIEILLSPEGYELVILEDGRQVLEYLRSNTPNIALIDSEMPHVDGFDICNKMKRIKRLSHIPVIVMTPPSKEGSLERAKLDAMAREVKADLNVSKPLGDKNLRDNIKQLLNASQGISLRQTGVASLGNTVIIEQALDTVSPSLSKSVESASNLAKLKMLEAENKLLRQQVSELEKDLQQSQQQDSDVRVLQSKIAELTRQNQKLLKQLRLIESSRSRSNQ